MLCLFHEPENDCSTKFPLVVIVHLQDLVKCRCVYYIIFLGGALGLAISSAQSRVFEGNRRVGCRLTLSLSLSLSIPLSPFSFLVASADGMLRYHESAEPKNSRVTDHKATTVRMEKCL